MYAIVDIETTGSHAHANGITEIAIVLHNGNEIEGRYETLINPQVLIPRYVASLTGISNQMVAVAPCFNEVASQIFNLLNGRIFVAHNVNFDYSFIKYHLQNAGYNWNARKLCTLRLCRKAFPGFIKYGLGHICRELKITVENRHRAGGDANATSILFDMILKKGGDKIIKDFLKKEAREQILPPNLPKEHIKNLPYVPGVYYFHNAKGKVIYVGKAKCLKHRVVSHFTGLDTSKKRQEFLRNIYSITFKECPTEFTACILESIEIKRLWPEYNISQKRPEQQYGIYFFEDASGYYRLAIDKKRKYFQPIISFNLKTDAHRALLKMVKLFQLDAALCFLDSTAKNKPDEDCNSYNKKVKDAINWLRSQKETFVIREQEKNSLSYILVEQGNFYGMAFVKKEIEHLQINELKKQINPYPSNEVIHSMIYSFIERYPHKVQRLVV
ncbi:MAG: exonuclease domain-containing protein [Chitinophagaceae bacterium]